MDFVSLTLLVILITCVIIYAFQLLSHRKSKLPPEPFGLPVFGHLFSLGSKPHIAHTRYKKYGPICIVRAGMTPYVLLNSYQAINEAFIEQGDNFAGRPKEKFQHVVNRDTGIIHTDGPTWKEHRRLVLRMMREFGSGRSSGENIVSEECQALREKLLDLSDTPVDTKFIYASCINNVISRLVFGERCGSVDPGFEEFRRHLDCVFSPTMIDMLLLFFPFIRDIPPLLKLHQRVSPRYFSFHRMHEYIMQKITQHKEALHTMDPPLTEVSQAHDICEAFIIEQANQEASNPGGHTFTDWQLKNDMLDLFVAGTETTATTLSWATLLLAIHPDIQRRIHQEIEEKIGRERIATMADRLQLPYVCAVMDEVLRYSSMAADNLPHRCLQETTVMGYTIPADMTIVSNLYGVHHDPDLWARPEEFYPDHFLTQQGEYRPSKYLIPFSIGKRACLGESLARMEYFMALVTVMQTFEVRLVRPESKHEILSKVRGRPVLSPGKHEIVFSKL